ncbi:11394_t:CDS:2, partial [Acaulospora colombiana]
EEDESWPQLESPSGDIRKMEKLLRKRELSMMSSTVTAFSCIVGVVLVLLSSPHFYIRLDSGHGEQVQGKDYAEKDGKDE